MRNDIRYMVPILKIFHELHLINKQIVDVVKNI